MPDWRSLQEDLERALELAHGRSRNVGRKGFDLSSAFEVEVTPVSNRECTIASRLPWASLSGLSYAPLHQ